MVQAQTSLQALTPEMQEILAQWNNVRPVSHVGLTFNEIRVDNLKLFTEGDHKGEANPNFGKLFAEANGEVVEIDITKAQFLPLMYRYKVSGEYNKAEEKYEHYSYETDTLEHIQVFDGDTKELVAEGNYFELKDTYNLSSVDVFYVFFNGTIYRWEMKCGGFEVTRDLKRMMNKTSFPTHFKITNIEAMVNGAIWFNKFTFAISEEIKDYEGIAGVVETTRTLRQALEEYEEGRSNRKAQKSLASSAPVAKKAPAISPEQEAKMLKDTQAVFESLPEVTAEIEQRQEIASQEDSLPETDKASMLASLQNIG